MKIPVTPDELLTQLEKMAIAGEEYAKARRDRIYLDDYKDVVLARLMKASDAESVAAKKIDAQAHPDYEKVINDGADADYLEKILLWKKDCLMAILDLSRTIQANNRAVGDRI